MQSHAILKVMELELASAHESLATKADLVELRLATKVDLAEVRADLTEVRIEVRSIEGKMARWVLTCILGQTAMLAGLGYFALSHLQR